MCVNLENFDSNIYREAVEYRNSCWDKVTHKNFPATLLSLAWKRDQGLVDIELGESIISPRKLCTRSFNFNVHFQNGRRLY